MKIRVANMGPIAKAEVQLNDLTVFIGPNNSGKSILATAIYGALSLRMPRYLMNYTRMSVRALGFPDKEEGDAEFSSLLRNNYLCDYSDLSDRMIHFFSQALSSQLRYNFQSLQVEMARLYGSGVDALRRPRKRLIFELASSAPNWSMAIEMTAKDKVERFAPPNLEEVWRLVQEKDKYQKFGIARRITSRVSRRGGSLDPSYVASEIIYELFQVCFREAPSRVSYLPAARSGLMQAHKALASFLIRSAATVGLREVSIPAMSGVVVDFLEDLLEVNPRRGGTSFQSQAKELEKEIIKGKIVSEGSESGYPQFFYEVGEFRYPLESSSSMISEIAPVVMYLRNMVSVGDLLIIEEPEAHLHPSSQTAFAKVVASLVNKGLKVAITTHSEFFLQQINNFIVASSIPRKKAEEVGISKSYMLKPSCVSAYLFQSNSSGTEVVELEVNNEEGISDVSFSSVEEYLYDQAVKIERAQ